MHFEDEHALYKRVKEELVTGFSGDLDEMNVVYITLYLITNFLAFQVVIGFLSAHFSWFKRLRTDIYKNRWKILFCSLFDITCSVLPIICIIAEYKHAHLFHLSAFSLIFLLMLIHVLTGKQKTDPIFTTWLLPGGENKYRRFYTVDTKSIKVKQKTVKDETSEVVEKTY